MAAKRLNRKQLIADFEQLRAGFDQAVLRAIYAEDNISKLGFAAHYYLANKRVAELGGEPYQISWIIEYYKEEVKEMSKALKGILDKNQELIDDYERGTRTL